MQVLNQADEVTALSQQWQQQDHKIAFVPTMGCLHQGHLGLVAKAGEIADRVVVSIFVNPLQFNDKNDLENYPRTLDEDLAKLSALNVDLVFTPTVDDFYPEGEDRVEKIPVGELATILEGEHRPGHFEGVATVVKRLFDITRPDYAIFGEKDFQQLLVIRQLANTYCPGISIIGMPTQREADGLAMSSRNVRLSATERETASQIYRELIAARDAIREGNHDFTALQEKAAKHLKNKGFEVEYVEVRDADSLQAINLSASQHLVILAAARLGNVRLIDNIRV